MQKYIVPAKVNLEKWKSFFEEVFRADEHQEDMLKVLVTLAMWLSTTESTPSQERHNTLIELCVMALDFTGELSDTGMLDKAYVAPASVIACEFATALHDFLKGAGVVQGPTVLSFSGFTGMDIIVKVFAPGEVDDTWMKSCLSG